MAYTIVPLKENWPLRANPGRGSSEEILSVSIAYRSGQPKGGGNRTDKR